MTRSRRKPCQPGSTPTGGALAIRAGFRRVQQFPERLLPTGAQRRDVEGLPQLFDIPLRQVEQGVDVSDAESMCT